MRRSGDHFNHPGHMVVIPGMGLSVVEGLMALLVLLIGLLIPHFSLLTVRKRQSLEQSDQHRFRQ